jgi:phosphate-selective porin OprO/OprP
LLSLVGFASTAVLSLEAQEPAPAAGFQDGFFLQSPDGDNRLQIGAVIQVDGRFSLDDTLSSTNTFAIRKARPILTGHAARHFDFRFMADFGSGTTVLLDAYVDLRVSPSFRIRVGKDKTPVGYELLIGDAFLLFPERALASSLVPNRDVGLAVQGDLAGGRVFYSGGVFNGVPDGSSSTADVDTRRAKDLAGRLVIQPFRSPQSPSPLSGLGIQIGGSRGDQSGALPTFRTSAGQAYYSYAATARADGARTRVAPAVFYYWRSLGVFAEYVRSRQEITDGTVDVTAANEGWEVTGSLVLSGEAASDRGVRPKASSDPAAGPWGALQLVARLTELRVDEEAFAAGVAAAGATRRARAWAVGLNWYPTTFSKYYLNFERTVFYGATAAPRPPENLLLVRVQLAM